MHNVLIRKVGYWVCSVAGRDQARHTSLRRATVASHTVSRRATVAMQPTVYLAMPSPIVPARAPYGAHWPILTLIYFPLATCVRVSHLAPHFSHIRLASGEPVNSMDGLLSQILGKTYQLSSSCPHSTFHLHFFF